jgi:DNA-binding CsgD family transcriptional regulator
LTAREREIVNLVLAGRTAREIADALVISDRTVETHVASVYRKLGVSNRHELSALVDETSLEPSLVRAAPRS